MMMMREHEISDRRLSEPFYSVVPISCYGSYSLYHDVLLAIVSCHGLHPPNHLYVILLYDNRTGVDQCLWLSLIFGCL
jgi:hypothetical protein